MPTEIGNEYSTRSRLPPLKPYEPCQFGTTPAVEQYQAWCIGIMTRHIPDAQSCAIRAIKSPFLELNVPLHRCGGFAMGQCPSRGAARRIPCVLRADHGQNQDHDHICPEKQRKQANHCQTLLVLCVDWFRRLSQLEICVGYFPAGRFLPKYAGRNEDTCPGSDVLGGLDRACRRRGSTGTRPKGIFSGLIGHFQRERAL